MCLYLEDSFFPPKTNSTHIGCCHFTQLRYKNQTNEEEKTEDICLVSIYCEYYVNNSMQTISKGESNGDLSIIMLTIAILTLG